ncbi:MAG: segregation/condensation protein A [Oscillospiraceae bacterium]|jgi:segregation and condensation protein A|nr:segregation/condensation protein A [Oscillospiraceae bacterium]
MENPVFHLTAVVQNRTGAEDFTGPLALILQLLSRNKIAVRDISISLILEQYLRYLEEMRAFDLDVASEFVAMASHLTYIKTRMLLGEDRPEELEELISSLERLRATDVYVGIKAVTETFAAMYLTGAGYIAKPPEYLKPDNDYKYSHVATDLADALGAILSRAATGERVATAVREAYTKPEAFPIADKLAEIAERAARFGTLALAGLFAECVTRSETVAAFLAILELCREGRVTLSEDNAELSISYQGGEA